MPPPRQPAGLGLALLALAGCTAADPPPPGAPVAAPQLFVEVTSEWLPPAGDEAWPDGTFFLPELMGGGVALFDYDGDLDLDLLQVRCPPPGQPTAPAPNRLFAQQAPGRFADVTAAAGLGDPGYGQGVAVGDADGDGDLDIYFANFGPDAYYRNEGDGTFSDATAAAGFSGDAWSVGAAFCDYDRDGDLDLYVVHYLELDPRASCRGGNLAPEYCGPLEHQGVLDTLYRNDGDGTFTDVTASAGIDWPGRGMGVLCADLTGDGWTDVYVANDKEVNQLWVNRRDGSFADEAIIRGAGFNADGAAEASMGITAGDMDRDGWLDLFISNLQYESDRLLRGTELGVFEDVTAAAGMSPVDSPFTGFGCGFADFDHDGDLDLAVANGRIARGRLFPDASISDFWNFYAEPSLLFLNDGRGRFSDASRAAGSFGSRPDIGRGLALGDLDRDGDVDLVLGRLTGPPRIFRNDAPQAGSHWLVVRAVSGAQDALGARVTAVAGQRRFSALALAAYSYASSSDPRAHLGLGAVDALDSIEVEWPDGSRERFPGGPADRWVELRQGTGLP